MEQELSGSIEKWESTDVPVRAKTSSGKRKHSGDGSGSGSGSTTAPPTSSPGASTRARTSHGRHRTSGRDSGVEVYSIDPGPAADPKLDRESLKRPAHGGSFPGILEAADSAASLADGPGPAPPRSAHSRRRTRAAPVDSASHVVAHGRSLENELSLEEFSTNTRKELNYFDPDALGNTDADVDNPNSNFRSSLKRGGSFKGSATAAATSDRNRSSRAQRNTVVGPVEVDYRQQRRPSLQRGGSFKGAGAGSGGGLRREGSFKGGRREGDGDKPSFQRAGSFRAGQVAPQNTISSKDHQRMAHMSALKKQTSWTRASPAPSPKPSPKEGNFSFLSRLKESIFGGEGVTPVDAAPADPREPGGDPLSWAGSGSRISRENSLSNLTKQLDDSDYAGSNRPRDNVAPSERLKYAMRRNTDADVTEDRRTSAAASTPDSSLVYPKPASDQLSIVRFKLDEGQKALEKRLLISNAEAMHKYPGPHPETLNNVRKKHPTFLSLMDGMSIVTHNMVIGSRYDAEDLGALRKLGISYVLNITDRIPNYFPDVLIYHKIEIQDKPSTQLDAAFRSAAGFLQRVEANKGRVLIHCVAGVSRSVSIFLMYIMAFYHIRLNSLWNHVYSIRPYIGPNEGFCLQLAHFEVEHLGALSVGKHTSKHWDFYGLNSIIASLPKDYSGNAAEAPIACCIVQ